MKSTSPLSRERESNEMSQHPPTPVWVVSPQTMRLFLLPSFGRLFNWITFHLLLVLPVSCSLWPSVVCCSGVMVPFFRRSSFTGLLLAFTGLLLGCYWVVTGLLLGFHWLSMRFTGFYWVLLGSTEFDWVSMRFPGFFYWLLLALTGLYWVLLVFNWFYWVLLGFTGFQCVFLVFYWLLLALTGLYWVLLVFNWFYWVLLGFTAY